MKKRITAWGILFTLAILFTGCVPANTVHSLEDLPGKNIGVQRKTTGEVYAQEIQDVTVKKYNRGVDAVRSLKEGELDAVLIDDAPAKHFVQEVGGVKILDTPFAKEEYGIVVSKDKKALLQNINEALNQLEQEGVLEEIKEQWLLGKVTKTAYQSNEDAKKYTATLVVSTNAEFPPYESKDDKGEIVGMDIDIMKAVCDKLQMKLQVEDTAFDSIIASIQRGMSDVGIAALTITEERKEKVDFSAPYLEASQVVIVREK